MSSLYDIKLNCPSPNSSNLHTLGTEGRNSKEMPPSSQDNLKTNMGTDGKA